MSGSGGPHVMRALTPVFRSPTFTLTSGRYVHHSPVRPSCPESVSWICDSFLAVILPLRDLGPTVLPGSCCAARALFPCGLPLLPDRGPYAPSSLGAGF